MTLRVQRKFIYSLLPLQVEIIVHLPKGFSQWPCFISKQQRSPQILPIWQVTKKKKTTYPTGKSTSPRLEHTFAHRYMWVMRVAWYCLAHPFFACHYSLPDSGAENLLLQTSKSSISQQSGIQMTSISVAMATRKEVKIGYFEPFKANNL